MPSDGVGRQLFQSAFSFGKLFLTNSPTVLRVHSSLNVRPCTLRFARLPVLFGCLKNRSMAAGKWKETIGPDVGRNMLR